MKKVNEESLRLLVILKNDSRRLFERIKFRKNEYLTILSLKRTREHFKEIFISIYNTITIPELTLVSEEVLMALDEYYSCVEQLKWYLNYTEDMPLTMKDTVNLRVRDIESKYELLKLYINAEIGLDENEQRIENFVVPLAEDIFPASDEFANLDSLESLDDSEKES